MPEVIEVKTYVDFMRKHVKGQAIKSIDILNGRYKTHGPFKNFKQLFNDLPLRIDSIESKGKYTYISLSNGLYLCITLGLTGGWFWNPINTPKYIHGLQKTSSRYDPNDVDVYMKNAKKHLNIAFRFDHGTLYFYDQLSFGTISILNEQENQKKLNRIGLDILSDTFEFESFHKAITKPKNNNKYIGNVLMDQTTISGVGNYLRADVLWMCKLSPFRRVKDLSREDIRNLYTNLRRLVWGIYNRRVALHRGYMSKNDKLPIDYGRDFFVYMNDRDIYGNVIIKKKLYEGSQIRHIYYVEKYQN
jgi:DNA-formamidopyrimidine glycosylase